MWIGRVLGLALWGCVLACGACSGGGSAGGIGVDRVVEGESGRSEAEWEDLTAAVRYVTDRNEMAVVSVAAGSFERDGVGYRVRTYSIVTARDEPVWVRFEAPSEGAMRLRELAASRPSSVVVRVGRFGDDRRESELLGSILDRLDALRAID